MPLIPTVGFWFIAVFPSLPSTNLILSYNLIFNFPLLLFLLIFSLTILITVTSLALFQLSHSTENGIRYAETCLVSNLKVLCCFLT